MKERLSELEYYVLRERGTEPSGTGKYIDWDEEGVYNCKVCKTELFSSDAKFDCDCGWPSFKQGIKENLDFKRDNQHKMNRTEVLCSVCGSHLGHVFDDGPEPTGLRYCINSVSLVFERSSDQNKS